jgi:beta-fructofuranosidase
MGWLSEADRMELKDIRGWAGMQSVPREIKVNTDNELSIWPAEECKLLRKELLIEKTSFDAEEEKVLLASSLRAGEIYVRLDTGDKSGVVLYLFADEKGREETKLIYDGETGTLTLDRDCSSLYCEVDKTQINCPLKCCRELELRIFIDHSSIEVFVCHQATITARVYPKLEQSDHIYFEKHGDVTVKELKIWEAGI